MRILTGHLAATLLCLTPAYTSALSFPLLSADQDVVGVVKTVQTRYEDTLSDIARLYDLGYSEITTANPEVDPWLPGEGTTVTLPTRFILPAGPREGVVINLAELRIYYFPPDGKQVMTYPLGIGREGWSTPIGRSRITRKAQHPSWTPPDSIRAEYAERGETLPPVVKPGPDNPLGQYAIYLSMRGYLLHGTNKPYGVGMRVSHGCIRLYPEDIKELFPQLPVDTPVRIINQPYKAGWLDGRLYVEAHPPLSEQFQTEGINYTPMVKAVIGVLDDSTVKPDWSALKEAALQASGIPMPLSPPIKQATTTP